MSITPQVDAVVMHLYSDLLGRYWPPERRHIDTRYRTLPFAFAEIDLPANTLREPLCQRIIYAVP